MTTAKRLKPERGGDYVDAVRKLYPDVPGMADYCVYWFRRAHDHLPVCTADDPFRGRAGLVGTQNIRNNKSREGGLDYIVAPGSGGVIVDAVDNQPWSGEANVHVSIANWVKTPTQRGGQSVRSAGSGRSSFNQTQSTGKPDQSTGETARSTGQSDQSTGETARSTGQSDQSTGETARSTGQSDQSTGKTGRSTPGAGKNTPVEDRNTSDPARNTPAQHQNTPGPGSIHPAETSNTFVPGVDRSHLLIPDTRTLWFKLPPPPEAKSSRNKRGQGPATKQYELGKRETPFINAALSDATDVTGAVQLASVTAGSHVNEGVQTGHKGFVIARDEARRLAASHPEAGKFIKPFLNGSDLLSGKYLTQPE